MNPTLITWLVVIAVVLIFVAKNFGKDILKFYKEWKHNKKDDTRTQDKD